LTRVEARAAVEAEICEIRQIAVRERALPLHGREDGAESLAVAAGIADDELPVGLLQHLKRRHAAPPLARRSGRTPCRSAARTPRGRPCRGCCPPSPRPRPRCWTRADRPA